MPPAVEVSEQLRREIEDALNPVEENKFAGFCPIINNPSRRHCHRRPVKTIAVICLECGLRKQARVCLHHWWQIRRHNIGHHQPGTDPAGCKAGGPWHITREQEGIVHEKEE